MGIVKTIISETIDCVLTAHIVPENQFIRFRDNLISVMVAIGWTEDMSSWKDAIAKLTTLSRILSTTNIDEETTKNIVFWNPNNILSQFLSQKKWMYVTGVHDECV